MKKILAFLLSCVLLLSMTAAVAQEEAKTEADPFGRYEDEITITFVKSYNAAQDASMNLLNEEYGETWEDNRWIQLFKDELNINVEYQWVVDSSQYEQKWNLAMASGDLPDVMIVGLSDLQELAEAGLIQEMGSVWDEYASDYAKEAAEQVGDAWINGMKYDGEVMGIPGYASPIDYCRQLWIRYDWLEKLGLEPPETLDDLWNIFEAFCTQDPDGNGVDDTYAFMLQKDLWFELEGLCWAFGAYPDTWMEIGGNLEYGIIQPEMKSVLSFLADAYANGWIYPEFVTTNFLDYALVTNGKCGITAGTGALASFLKASYELDPEADWRMYVWPTEDGSMTSMELELEFGYTIVVNKDFEYPEAIVKMRNLYLSKVADPDTMDNNYDSDEKTGAGYVWMFGPFIASGKIYPDVTVGEEIRMYMNGEIAYDDMTAGAQTFYSLANSDIASTAWEYTRYRMPNGYSESDIQKIYIDGGYLFMNNFSGITAGMQEYSSVLTELINTYVTKCITNELDVEASWDDFVADWLRLGGEQITQEVNDWYHANN